ncbi:MAG: divalent-cation tolerance protein CutA [Novosphingobium sp.]|nr:divalent-cation tolerance protein CutA [Novosphingobium sp.]
MTAALIWCPFPDEDSAARTAHTLLDERLIACANMLPTMRSIFQWRGERGEAQETGAILKTDAALLDRAMARLADLHPYEQPAIVGWRCDRASAATRAWLEALAP